MGSERIVFGYYSWKAQPPNPLPPRYGPACSLIWNIHSLISTCASRVTFKWYWYLLESGAGVCAFYLTGLCSRGSSCPFRHVRVDRTVVCKHWLRGLCKKGDDCEFLHEYDMSKMPECYFFSKFGKLSLH